MVLVFKVLSGQINVSQRSAVLSHVAKLDPNCFAQNEFGHEVPRHKAGFFFLLVFRSDLGRIHPADTTLNPKRQVVKGHYQGTRVTVVDFGDQAP